MVIHYNLLLERYRCLKIKGPQTHLFLIGKEAFQRIFVGGFHGLFAMIVEGTAWDVGLVPKPWQIIGQK